MSLDPVPAPHVPCAICAAPVYAEARYPQKVCGDCAGRASDVAGRRLVFSNVSISGGFVATYADDGSPYPGGHACWIDGIACEADEHYFGGIVVERCAMPSPRIDLTDARVTLPCALAWRAIAEIARRRHRSHRLRLEQYHPGTSTRGVLALVLEPFDPGPSARHDIELGGPEPGRWRVRDEAGTEVATSNVALLLGPDPEHRIMWCESRARFAVMSEPLPRGGRFLRSIRLVAALLERRVFDRHPWRATLAAARWNGGTIVADWHAAFIAPVVKDAAGGLRPDDEHRLSQLVLVHGGEDCVITESNYRTGIAIDLRTDRAFQMDGKELKPFDTVTSHFRASGDSFARLVDRIDRSLDS